MEWWSQVLAVLTAVVSAIVAFYFGSRSRDIRDPKLPPLPSAEPMVPPRRPIIPDIPVPQPPDELLSGVEAGACILVVGSGMTAQAGLETWSQMFHAIVLGGDLWRDHDSPARPARCG